MIVSDIRLNPGEPIENAFRKARKIAGYENKNGIVCRLLKKSLDARKKNDIHFVCQVELENGGFSKTPEPYENTAYTYPENRPIIVGTGPAGLFCGLILARCGFRPVLVERGADVKTREKDVSAFFASCALNVESNIQFGEGGAGAFSDGKLNTGVKSPFKRWILEEFVAHGAPEEILYENKPHIGSDRLPTVVENIRKEIESLGGKYRFSTKLTGIAVENGRVSHADFVSFSGSQTVKIDDLVLAIGHSARDTVKMLYSSGVQMEAKDTAIGFRIEHKQESINVSQYGKDYDKSLPVADYKLVSQASDRGVFTFCMCPGGSVVAATSEENSVCTNGMSNFLRDGENANSAVVVQIRTDDYPSGVLGGLEYLSVFEKKAFEWGGKTYAAPCERIEDFLKENPNPTAGSVVPSYPCGVVYKPLHTFFNRELTSAIKKGISDMGKRLRGFDFSDAVLTAVETRTSSPVRILRDENGENPSAFGLFPAGETGYAGGIMSAAIDGIRVANLILKKYSKNQ